MKLLDHSYISWQMIKRSFDRRTIHTVDGGYDWWLLRQRLRAKGVKPVLKHREFGWHGIAKNLLQDDTTYHQRSNGESIPFRLRRKYREIVRERTWFGQFRELVLECALRNIGLNISHSRR